MRICTVVGARPQIVKASVLGPALAEAGIHEDLVHTGQHYDDQLSQVFFDELGLAPPSANLGVGSGTHSVQTAGIMVALEKYIAAQDPYDAVLVYGDTNSTLAAAIVAAKLCIPLVHVEAGVRSFNRTMPEEINRLLCDRLSSFLFCPTPTAVRHLEKEGIRDGVFLTGDVMRELIDDNRDRIDAGVPTRLAQLGPTEYYVCTIHREENVVNMKALAAIVRGLEALPLPVILPAHPRTRSQLANLAYNDRIRVVEPVGYRSMLALVSQSAGLVTDSGGLQKEAYWLAAPCVTVRQETEWPETLGGGWNKLVGTDPEQIARGFANSPASTRDTEFGRAPEDTPSRLICRLLRQELAT